MQLYTIYDLNTYKPISTMFYEDQPPNSTSVLCTENWADPRFNTNTNSWYNAATQEEQDTYLRIQKVNEQLSLINSEVMNIVNEEIVTWQTNSMLNEIYGNQLEGFKVFCPNLPNRSFEGSQTEYTKGKNGEWSYILIFKNTEE